MEITSKSDPVHVDKQGAESTLCLLLTIPLEVRLKILEYLFQGTKPIQFYGPRTSWRNEVYPNVLLICRQLHHEILPLLYQHSTVRLGSYQKIIAPRIPRRLFNIKNWTLTWQALSVSGHFPLPYEYDFLLIQLQTVCRRVQHLQRVTLFVSEHTTSPIQWEREKPVRVQGSNAREMGLSARFSSAADLYLFEAVKRIAKTIAFSQDPKHGIWVEFEAARNRGLYSDLDDKWLHA